MGFSGECFRRCGDPGATVFDRLGFQRDPTVCTARLAYRCGINAIVCSFHYVLWMGCVPVRPEADGMGYAWVANEGKAASDRRRPMRSGSGQRAVATNVFWCASARREI
jgi:hypothetical protein